MMLVYCIPLCCYRKRWKGDVFGSSDEDDIDALFSIYSNYLVCHNESTVMLCCVVTSVHCLIGVLLCMTHRSHNLFEVHNHLLSLNVTLRSMLDIEEAAYREMVSMNHTSKWTLDTVCRHINEYRYIATDVLQYNDILFDTKWIGIICCS